MYLHIYAITALCKALLLKPILLVHADVPPPEPVIDDSCYWTDWLDEDNPDGAGDYETLTFLAKFIDESQLCPSKPSDLQVRRVSDGQPPEQPLAYCDVDNGLLCLNYEQDEGEVCQDYEVRFLCCGGQETTTASSQEEEQGR